MSSLSALCRTLAPTWNESFEANIPSRVGAKFDIEVFDYNKVEQAKTLGVGRINLADLEPFEVAEQRVSLTSKEGVKGWVRVVSLLFTCRLSIPPVLTTPSSLPATRFPTCHHRQVEEEHLDVLHRWPGDDHGRTRPHRCRRRGWKGCLQGSGHGWAWSRTRRQLCGTQDRYVSTVSPPSLCAC